jgi:transcriptional regulator with XRE-family HTH domain
MVICGRLRTLPAEKKLSRRYIAKRTGLERRYISKVENGYIVPTVETLEKMAGALEVPLYTLFYDDEAPPRLGNLPNRKTCDDIAWGSSGKNTRISASARLAQKVSRQGTDDTGSREHHH